MSLSDEESFVILGSSPEPSIDSELPIENGIEKDELLTAENTMIDSSQEQSLKYNTPITSSFSGSNMTNSAISIITASSAQLPPPAPVTSVLQINTEGPKCLPDPVKECQMNEIKTSIKPRNSLAASFIMGEVNSDVLKTSVYSQFPSLCSMEACAEDVVKLENFMSEHIQLKEALSKLTLTMKQFYHSTQKWREERHKMEEERSIQIHDCQQQIAMLRNENMELKRDVGDKIEQTKINEDVRLKEQSDLAQSLSEKAAQIRNMSTQIEKLELQQLASFEYVSQNNETKDQPEYVPILEHQRVIKEFERKLSELVAKNLDYKDVQTQYIDEITCLKVNLVAAEELIKQSRADINMLQAKDMEKSKVFVEYESDRDHMKEEIALLRQQVELYSKDFEMERIARQNLAGEKDQLLSDLRALQRKNHELIAEEQKRWEENLSSNATSVSSSVKSSASSSVCSLTSRQKPIRYRDAVDLPTRPLPSQEAVSANRCPLCARTFKSLNILQSHVNECLDKN